VVSRPRVEIEVDEVLVAGASIDRAEVAAALREVGAGLADGSVAHADVADAVAAALQARADAGTEPR